MLSLFFICKNMSFEGYYCYPIVGILNLQWLVMVKIIYLFLFFFAKSK